MNTQRLILILASLLALVVLINGCDSVHDQPATPAEAATDEAAAEVSAAKGRPAHGRIVVANRGDGSISIIDTKRDAVVATIPLPGDTPAEPMYVVYIPPLHRVLVGDRANGQVVAFDARTFEVKGTVPAGEGIWHMWADPQSKQLWVADDVNNVLTVIDPKRLEVITTVAVEGGRPHDVIVDPKGDYAFASVVVADGADQVVKYSTTTFEEVDRSEVGEDPHLSLARQNNLLYVPSQGGHAVFVLNRTTMEVVTTLPVPGAHGAGMARNGKVFYTTNLPGGGSDGLFAIDTKTNTVIGAVDTPTSGTPLPVPHNVALTPGGKKLYLTHSGAAANQVTVYLVQGNDPLPVSIAVVEVGTNPFGLAYIP